HRGMAGGGGGASPAGAGPGGEPGHRGRRRGAGALDATAVSQRGRAAQDLGHHRRSGPGRPGAGADHRNPIRPLLAHAAGPAAGCRVHGGGAGMKAILPVAGVGTRLRPHTHTQPKTLVHVAGKPILGHILDRLLPVGVDEVVLIVGQWGDRVVEYVQGAYPQFKVTAIEQAERKGLGHAVYLAREAVPPEEPVLIVLGDTIFQADLKAAFQPGRSTIGVRRVADPRQYGVVELDGDRVRRLVEKPANPPSDLAVVGVYYLRKSGLLFDCLQEIIDAGIRVKGEYQLTDGLQRMIEKGEPLYTFPVENWWDCGNPET